MSDTPKQLFLKAFEEATDPVAGKEQMRQRGDVQFEVLGEVDTGLKLGETEVYLNGLRALKKRERKGTEAMAFLGALADRFNIDVVLHAAGLDDDSPSDSAIVQFYKQCGYMKCGPNNEMVRKAQNPGADAAPPAPPPL